MYDGYNIINLWVLSQLFSLFSQQYLQADLSMLRVVVVRVLVLLRMIRWHSKLIRNPESRVTRDTPYLLFKARFNSKYTMSAIFGYCTRGTGSASLSRPINQYIIVIGKYGDVAQYCSWLFDEIWCIVSVCSNVTVYPWLFPLERDSTQGHVPYPWLSSTRHTFHCKHSFIATKLHTWGNDRILWIQCLLPMSLSCTCYS